MPIKVIMPQLGESVTEGTISKWLINVGDKVKEFDPLLEINTDKVDSEIPSPVDGIVKKVLFKKDEIVAVGTVDCHVHAAGPECGAVDDDELVVHQGAAIIVHNGSGK